VSLLEYLQSDPECRNLAEGAVHVVAPMLEDPDPGPVLATLDSWAFDLAGHMPLPWSIHGAIDELNQFLFGEHGFHGDRQNYDDPANAALPLVLARRRGLPIALSILWIDLARRLGMDAVGIALPGHFIMGLRLDIGVLLFDPFNEGRALGQEDAAKIVRRVTGGRTEFDPAMLEPASHRAILLRLARNLYARYMKSESWEDALWASTHLVLLAPEDTSTYRDRAFVHLKRGDIFAALVDLQEAARLCQTEDPQLREWIDKLQKG